MIYKTVSMSLDSYKKIKILSAEKNLQIKETLKFLIDFFEEQEKLNKKDKK